MANLSQIADAHKIIDNIIYITLATSDLDNVPWCTPVFAACDQFYNFYWASGFETRHSMNIRYNPATGVTIYDSSVEEGKGEALYMEGQAYELTPDTWQEGLGLLRKKSKFPDKYYPRNDYKNLGAVRIYKFTPKKFYMLNPEGDPRYKTYADCRLEINLQ
jgi:hypothetical protein